MPAGPYDEKKGITHKDCGAELGYATGLEICPNCKKRLTPENTEETHL